MTKGCSNSEFRHSSFVIRHSSFLALSLAIVAACRPSGGDLPQMAVFSGDTMGTWYTVKVVDPPASVDLEALDGQIRDTLSRVDALMSTYRPDSELSRLNRCDLPAMEHENASPNGREWFAVSHETAAVIHEAVEIGRLTHGAFDVTVAPLVDLWNFGPERRAVDTVPSPDEIEEAKARIGLEKLEVRLSPPAVRKGQNDLQIDLSGIAKGFAVDQVADELDGLGIPSYMVDVGGEVKARGRNRKGRPWQIGVESPSNRWDISGVPPNGRGTRGIQKVIPLDGVAVATSGDYRNYFEQDGVRYCHIIDPRSGRPISHKLASVSVIAQSCTRADALATGLMVLGPEAGYNLAVEEELAALFLVKSRTGFVEKMTPRFQELLRQPIAP